VTIEKRLGELLSQPGFSQMEERLEIRLVLLVNAFRKFEHVHGSPLQSMVLDQWEAHCRLTRVPTGHAGSNHRSPVA
jgi:hypothetical protein